jgi:hypothetical protein
MAAKKDDPTLVEEKISQLPAFQSMALKVHQAILKANPNLVPRLWYGMPGYALSPKSPVLCFFRVDDEQYLTLGLSEQAQHSVSSRSKSTLMPCAWFLTTLNKDTEAEIAEIVRSATTNS